MKTKFYMALPVLLLLASLIGWAVMVTLAVDDPTFAVEKDYYQKAARHDERKDELQRSAKLGWKLRVTRFDKVSGSGAAITMTLTRRDGQPISSAHVELEGLANLRSSDVQTVTLSGDEAGVYSGSLPRAWPGLWELRARVRLGNEEYVEVLRAELGGGRT